MKKALLVSTVSGFIPQFEMNNVHILQRLGYEVHYASNYNMPSYGTDNRRLDGTGILRHQIDFVRSPFKRENIAVYLKLKELMKRERFDLVHCHTPMGGVMARLAAHATATKPVIYTAHGFHFYKKAPLINWLCYYPMERLLAHYTDQLICINLEDYQRAKRFKVKYVDYVPGVGLDRCRLEHGKDVDKKEMKKELGLAEGKKILLSCGELIKRKNHETVIRALAQNKDESLIYVICGHGELEEYLKKLAEELSVSERVRFLGYRTDMPKLFQTADVFIFPSYQEGLPMALLEAVAFGLPVICSNIRGNRDLMGEGNKRGMLEFCQGGIMVENAADVTAYGKAIAYMFSGQASLEDMKGYNRRRSAEFGMDKVSERMEEIYLRWVDQEQEN